MKADDAMATVVASMIEQIADGGDTWTMPWNTLATLPRNGVTGKNYRGGNIMSLLSTQLYRGYESLEWATYKQWQSVEGQVTKGAKAAWIIVWKPIENKADPDKKRMFARAYPVFNRDVVDGAPPAPEGERTLDAHLFFDAIPAKIVEGSPAYAPELDVVMMPKIDNCTSDDHYHSILAHELGHWTGHHSRLNREQSTIDRDKYAIEELIAELSAAFTLHHLRSELDLPIMPAARFDHAAYLRHWVAQLKAKPSILWSVASKAQAATDHLLSYSTTVDTEEDTDATAQLQAV
jgi:antirestriction protein ArdC